MALEQRPDGLEERRKNVSGIWLPFIPGVTPNSGKDAEWRAQSGWGYSSITADTPPTGGQPFYIRDNYTMPPFLGMGPS